MLFGRATRLVKAGVLFGGCSLAGLHLAPARGTVDANERVSSAMLEKPSNPHRARHLPGVMPNLRANIRVKCG